MNDDMIALLKQILTTLEALTTTADSLNDAIVLIQDDLERIEAKFDEFNLNTGSGYSIELES